MYERLKEQREKKQYETEEASRLSRFWIESFLANFVFFFNACVLFFLEHLVRGLDSEEVGFLDFVDNMKAAEENKRRIEEKNLILEIKKTMETETLVEQPSTASIVAVPKKSSAAKGPSKQAQIISAGIKRKR